MSSNFRSNQLRSYTYATSIEADVVNDPENPGELFFSLCIKPEKGIRRRFYASIDELENLYQEIRKLRR